MILFVLWCLACLASFPSKSQRNRTWRFWTFGYFQNLLFWAGFRHGVLNIQEFPNVRICIGIFIVLVVLYCCNLRSRPLSTTTLTCRVKSNLNGRQRVTSNKGHSFIKRPHVQHLPSLENFTTNQTSFSQAVFKQSVSVLSVLT